MYTLIIWLSNIIFLRSIYHRSYFIHQKHSIYQTLADLPKTQMINLYTTYSMYQKIKSIFQIFRSIKNSNHESVYDKEVILSTRRVIQSTKHSYIYIYIYKLKWWLCIYQWSYSIYQKENSIYQTLRSTKILNHIYQTTYSIYQKTNLIYQILIYTKNSKLNMYIRTKH